MAKRREISIFNLSFLDVLSCGMGAIILLTLIFSTLVRRSVSSNNTKLIILLEYLDPQEHWKRGNLPRLRSKKRSLRPSLFSRVKNRPNVAILTRSYIPKGEWELQLPEDNYQSKPYSLFILYGGKMLSPSQAIQLRKQNPGILYVSKVIRFQLH